MKNLIYFYITVYKLKHICSLGHILTKRANIIFDSLNLLHLIVFDTLVQELIKLKMRVLQDASQSF